MAKVNGVVAAFLSKTYDMVDDSSTNSVVSWGDNNNNSSFVVWNVMEFATHILPKYFKHNNFSSFVRQLNTYLQVDPDRWEFANEGFVRGQKQLLKSISRRKSSHVNGSSQQPSQVQNSPVWACVEVGKFGFEEQVERLKRDKNVIMQEIVRLSQQQQMTDNQLQTVGQRLQVMEQRQQQMMSFLGKAVHSPGFLAQFVQPQNESNRHITEGNEKRRFHRQEEDSLATKNHHIALDGRVVKYQPSINEAAKALFFQILQMNNSTRTESSIKNHDAFLIDDVPWATELDSCSSSTQVSGVTLSEVLPTSGGSYMAVESQFPVNGVTNCTTEVQSSHAVLTDSVKGAGIPKLTAHNCQNNVLNFGEVQGIGTESSFMNSGLNFVGPHTGNAEDIDMMSTVLDGTLSVEADAISPDAEGKSKLPGINDEFWELFLRSNPPTGGTDEVICSSLGYGLTEDHELSSE